MDNIDIILTLVPPTYKIGDASSATTLSLFFFLLYLLLLQIRPSDIGINTVKERAVPIIPKHVKFRFNEPRKEWVILAPERLVKLDPIAVEILQLVDGERKVKKIAEELAKKFNAPIETILADVIEMLQNLSDKGFIEENG